MSLREFLDERIDGTVRHLVPPTESFETLKVTEFDSGERKLDPEDVRRYMSTLGYTCGDNPGQVQVSINALSAGISTIVVTYPTQNL